MTDPTGAEKDGVEELRASDDVSPGANICGKQYTNIVVDCVSLGFCLSCMENERDV